MAGWIEYLMSPQGMPLVNGGACAIFVGLIAVAIVTRTINLGSAVPRIRMIDNPRVYWSVLSLYGAIALWMGVTAVFGLLRR